MCLNGGSADKSHIAPYTFHIYPRHDVSKNIQRFFMGHTDEVLCMDMHPTRSLVASGQRGRLPKVRMIARNCPPLLVEDGDTFNSQYMNARVA